MANSINKLPNNFITSLCLCILFFGVGGSCQSVPGMYVFGDSLVDVGNNIYLPVTIARANMPHNGVDFPTGKPTGRFSNGKNAADFLAEKVGLPSPPSFMSFMPKSKLFMKINPVPITGVSFASGGAGILDGTDELFKQSIPLTKQVNYFSRVRDQLTQRLGSNEAKAHLSKSLFLVVIGSNDLLEYKNSSRVSKKYTPQQYVDLMISTFKGLFKRLYEMGARKFAVNAIGIIGCCPALRMTSTTSECNMDANRITKMYNDALKALLEELKTELSDMHYSYFDTYKVADNVTQHAETYGITEIKEACCGRGNLKAESPCSPLATYCSNRKSYLFWDLYHPTEYTSSIFADLIYSGSQEVTTPLNVEQLVNV